jgi:pyruvate/2-oxoglutarate dehydrogenase complex dihydrolipoamide dehydrogenase (E3) component
MGEGYPAWSQARRFFLRGRGVWVSTSVGDCTDFLPLASVSAMQGRTAVFHTMGDVSAPTELRNVAANVFTDPEIASVGWSQAAVEQGEPSQPAMKPLDIDTKALTTPMGRAESR